MKILILLFLAIAPNFFIAQKIKKILLNADMEKTSIKNAEYCRYQRKIDKNTIEFEVRDYFYQDKIIKRGIEIRNKNYRCLMNYSKLDQNSTYKDILGSIDKWYKVDSIIYKNRAITDSYMFYKSGAIKSHGDSSFYKSGELKSVFNKNYYKSGQIYYINYNELGKVFQDSVVKAYYEDGRLKRDNGKCYNSDGFESSYYPFIVTPSFKGGHEELRRFLQANLVYPTLAKESGINGVVYVQFTVKINGDIVNTKVLYGVGGGCNKEALRVVNLMKTKKVVWNPGKIDRKITDMEVILPIRFSLY